MSKFKAGDKIWHVIHGIQIVKYIDLEETNYPVVASSRITYTTEGKQYLTNKYPTIYTLDEARKRGFDVPMQEHRHLFTDTTIGRGVDGVFWVQVPDTTSNNKVLSSLRDKVGTLTFKYVE